MEPTTTTKNLTPFIIGGILIFIVVLAVVAAIGVSMILSATKNVSVVPAPPAPTPPPVVTVPTTSKFATDSAALQIKADLLKLMSDTDSVDLLEPQISPPNLDLSISVKSQ